MLLLSMLNYLVISLFILLIVCSYLSQALYTTKKFTNPFITTHRVVNREYGTCSSSSDLDTDEMTQTSYLKTINQI